MNTSNQKAKPASTLRAGLAGLLLAWFAVAYVIGTEQLLVNEAGSFFAPIALTAFVPVAGFLAAYALSARFQGWVLSLDIRSLTMLMHWRVVGFVFLPLYFFGVLPGLFAWPAGVGDVAVGLAAPFIVARLSRDPAWETSAGLVRYQLLGLLDFVVAIVTSGLAAGGFSWLAANGVTSAALDIWPLNLFPSFIVPLFIIIHLSVLLKVRHLRRLAQHPAAMAVATV